MGQLGTLTVVGPGLIGGSIGLAAKQRGVAQRVLGVVRRESSGARAVECGAVDQALTDLADAARQSDLVVVCTPVSQVAQQVLAAAAELPAGAVVTDAGSTKGKIVTQVERDLPEGALFVGSHPMAGDHKSGPESARADLLEGRVVVVTPTPSTNPSALERASDFWTALGARVVQMSPAEHDAAVAVTSHAPHALASVLAASTPAPLLPLTGGGWRDTTRVAAGGPQLWRDILMDNRHEVGDAIDRFTDLLGTLRQALANNNGVLVQQILEQAKERRDALGS